MNAVLAFFSPGPGEMLVIGVIAVLLFGKRLPEVGRSLGRSFIEFKKGLNGIEDDLRSATSASTTTSSTRSFAAADRQEPTAPKFEPPATEPKDDPIKT